MAIKAITGIMGIKAIIGIMTITGIMVKYAEIKIYFSFC